jgi:hypothetical protein
MPDRAWETRAACRNSASEMVPDDSRQGVDLAKKVCAGCPVVSSCFAQAQRLTAVHGRQYPQGVWGGLTLQERNTMVGLDRDPVPCPGCGLICVPVSYATNRCQVCDPKTRLTYLDYRDRITRLIASGSSYQQVAAALRLGHVAVASACGRWGIKAQTASPRVRHALKECGTLAAKSRHARHGESWENCACKHVPWKRGVTRRRTP